MKKRGHFRRHLGTVGAGNVFIGCNPSSLALRDMGQRSLISRHNYAFSLANNPHKAPPLWARLSAVIVACLCNHYFIRCYGGLIHLNNLFISTSLRADFFYLYIEEHSNPSPIVLMREGLQCSYSSIISKNSYRFMPISISLKT